jgi:hypothetical protein
MAWTHNGPVSVPPTPVVGFVAFAIGAAAIAAVGLGVRASWRDVSRPAAGEIDTQISGQAVAAQPIVEFAQPEAPAPAATNTAAAATNSAKAAADSEDIAAKTAAVQAVQSKPSQSTGNIDDILTSSSEKPQAPAKPSTDEAPPSAPPKSDVPF